MWKFVLALLAASAICGFRAYQEIRLAAVTEKRAQPLTLAELETNGYGDNAHVLLSDVHVVDGDFVYETDRGEWTAAWVPAAPAGADVQQLQDFVNARAGSARDAALRIAGQSASLGSLLKLPKARRVQDVADVARRREIRGIVVSDIELPESGTRTLLRRSYPGLDLDRCVIVEVGREPPEPLTVVLWVTGCLGALAMAGFLVFVRVQETRAAG